MAEDNSKLDHDLAPKRRDNFGINPHTDLSLMRLSLKFKIPIASGDKSLRQFAKKLGISITGSLGLLKSLYQNKIIKTREEYISFLDSLQKDIYISEELMEWALEE